MSQNKTVIQGLEPEDPRSNGGMNDFYARSGRPAARGTVVPNMMGNQPNQGNYPGGNSLQQPSRGNAIAGRPIVTGKPTIGFFYSISKTAIGEFWPLHIGRNTIGQNPSSDIVLAEGTVSIDHAVIVVRQIKNTGGIIAAITDTQSTNGTMINGETIGFSAVECHNGDVITIGNNYELVLVLIDATKLGLSVSQDFIATQVQEEETTDIDDGFPNFNPGATNAGGGGFTPYSEKPTYGGSEYIPNNGTVGMDGSINNKSGGTIPM